jgi:hypothetical protein
MQAVGGVMCSKGGGIELQEQRNLKFASLASYERPENWITNTLLSGENGDTYREEVVSR